MVRITSTHPSLTEVSDGSESEREVERKREREGGNERNREVKATWLRGREMGRECQTSGQQPRKQV